MKRIFIGFIMVGFLAASNLYAQLLPDLKFKDNHINKQETKFSGLTKAENKDIFQVKKRKAVNMYFGAGYSFVIFTAGPMKDLYPLFNQSAGDFLSEINLFFGVAVAKAVTLEFEPSILFTNNNTLVTYTLNPPYFDGANYYSYANTQHASMLAFPLAINVRFFPFNKLDKSFIRLFFVGGGAGTVWIREEYNIFYSNTPGYFGSGIYSYITQSTSQWAPLFRVMTGFTGSGGMFGFGGEIRFNIVPLKTSNDPFATRQAKNFNSVDLALKFYFSL